MGTASSKDAAKAFADRIASMALDAQLVYAAGILEQGGSIAVALAIIDHVRDRLVERLDLDQDV